MSNFHRLPALLLAGSLAVGASADIVSYSDSVTYFVDQVYDDYLGAMNYYPVSTYAVGPSPTSFADGLVTNMYGTDFLQTEASYSSAFTTSTSQYLQWDAMFSASSATYADLAWNGMQADAGGYEYLTFETDAAAVVTIESYDSSFFALGNGFGASIFVLDSDYLHSTPDDASYTQVVGAGIHTIRVEANVSSLSGYFYRYGHFSSAELFSKYRVTVASTPEPCTLAVFGFAGIGLLRRRKARG